MIVPPSVCVEESYNFGYRLSILDIPRFLSNYQTKKKSHRKRYWGHDMLSVSARSKLKV